MNLRLVCLAIITTSGIRGLFSQYTILHGFQISGDFDKEPIKSFLHSNVSVLIHQIQQETNSIKPTEITNLNEYLHQFSSAGCLIHLDNYQHTNLPGLMYPTIQRRLVPALLNRTTIFSGSEYQSSEISIKWVLSTLQRSFNFTGYSISCPVSNLFSGVNEDGMKFGKQIMLSKYAEQTRPWRYSSKVSIFLPYYPTKYYNWFSDGTGVLKTVNLRCNNAFHYGSNFGIDIILQSSTPNVDAILLGPDNSDLNTMTHYVNYKIQTFGGLHAPAVNHEIITALITENFNNIANICQKPLKILSATLFCVTCKVNIYKKTSFHTLSLLGLRQKNMYPFTYFQHSWVIFAATFNNHHVKGTFVHHMHLCENKIPAKPRNVRYFGKLADKLARAQANVWQSIMEKRYKATCYKVGSKQFSNNGKF